MNLTSNANWQKNTHNIASIHDSTDICKKKHMTIFIIQTSIIISIISSSSCSFRRVDRQIIIIIITSLLEIVSTLFLLLILLSHFLHLGLRITGYVGRRLCSVVRLLHSLASNTLSRELLRCRRSSSFFPPSTRTSSLHVEIFLKILPSVLYICS